MPLHKDFSMQNVPKCQNFIQEIDSQTKRKIRVTFLTCPKVLPLLYEYDLDNSVSWNVKNLIKNLQIVTQSDYQHIDAKQYSFFIASMAKFGSLELLGDTVWIDFKHFNPSRLSKHVHEN
jgi:hypothetical protein